MALRPCWGCDLVLWGKGAATQVKQSSVLLEETQAEV